MSDQNVDLVRGAYESFARGDVPQVIGILADDVEWTVGPPLPQAMDAHGREDVGRFFERIGSIYEQLEVKPRDFVASDDRVCVVGSASGKSDGRDVAYDFAHVWQLADGKARTFTEYSLPREGLA
jgi:ketosteroid isomerase-like protein